MASEQLPLDPIQTATIQFRQRKKYWEEFFTSADDNQVKTLASNALDELNSLWGLKGLMGQEVYVSGYGLWTEPCSKEDKDEYEKLNIFNLQILKNIDGVIKPGYVRCMKGHSLGMDLVSFDDEERPSLSYKFVNQEDCGADSSFFGVHVSYRIQIKLGTLSMIPVQEMHDVLTKVAVNLDKNNYQVQNN